MKTYRYAAGCAAVLLAFAGTGIPLARDAYAATVHKTGPSIMQKREISIDGQTLYSPYSFVYGDTTYMPIWYVISALRHLGVQNSWNGAHMQWRVALKTESPPVQASRLAGIYLGGVRVENIPALIRRDPASGVKTTFMPIWYVSRVLKTVNIHSSWDGRVWDLVEQGLAAGGASASAGTAGSASSGGPSSSTTTGSASSGGPGSSSTTTGTGAQGGATTSGSSSGGPGSSSTTTGSASSGKTAASSGGSSASWTPTAIASPSIVQKNGQLTIDGQTVPQISLQNAATNDQAWWRRASSDFYVSVQSNNPATDTAGTPLLAAAPGQSLYLFAFRNTASVSTAGTKWFVNSPDATVTPGRAIWTSGRNQTAKADFSATQPGIYTVQAEYAGKYSEPLVITVGFNQLTASPFSVPAALTGVLPLPAGVSSAPAQTQSGITYSPTQAVGDWLPVSGSTTLNITSVTALLLPQNGQGQTVWDFRLPVVNGHFSGLLRSPFSGPVQVVLFPNYLQTLTRIADTSANGSFSLPVPSSSYDVNVSGTPPGVLARSLLPSSQGDYNMSPRFASTAAVLLENSPSLQTAIQAISNYASEVLLYNSNEIQTGANGSLPHYKYQSNLAAWNAGSGVCQDYATLAESLLQSVGLPTQLLGGYANPSWTTLPASDSNPLDSHAWIQVWTGSGWMPIDPTWADAGAVSVNAMITNQFFGNTSDFLRTHLVEPAQSYYPMASGRKAPRVSPGKS